MKKEVIRKTITTGELETSQRSYYFPARDGREDIVIVATSYEEALLKLNQSLDNQK